MFLSYACLWFSDNRRDKILHWVVYGSLMLMVSQKMNKALFIISLFSVKLLDTMFSVKLKHKTYCYQQVLYYSVGTFHWICFTVVAAGIVRYTFTVHRQNTNTNSSTIQWHHQLWKVIHLLKSQITLISTCQDCAGSALKVDQY